jgi:diguanylate cyclase (GGDEF)-like protein/PAS domain S-box-containing protein
MQSIAVNIVVLSLMALLFSVIIRTRPDDRLRCWVAAWLCVVARFLAQLWQPAGLFEQHLQSFIIVGAMALAGMFFIISMMIMVEGRRAGVVLWLVMSGMTLAVFAPVAFGVRSVPLLSAMIIGRQCVAVYATLLRRDRPSVLTIMIPVNLAVGSLCVIAVVNGRPELVFSIILSGLYLVAAAGFWFNGWRRSLALHVMSTSLLIWSLTFLLPQALHHFWPLLVVDQGFWNIAAWFVAGGMVLMVLEEAAWRASAQAEEYRLAYDSNPHPLWIYDVDSLKFVDTNQATLDLHGYTRAEFLELRLPDILGPGVEGKVRESISSGQPVQTFASVHVRKDRSTLPMDITAHEIVFKGKKCRFVLGLDASVRNGLEQEIVRQSQRDALTGLCNRLLFEKLLVAAVEQADRNREMLAILCLDLCRFKHVNDVYGPRIGDECLRRVGAILMADVRSSDIVARTAGDEFAIVLTGIRSAVAAEQMAADLTAKLHEPLQIEGYKVKLAFSLGVAVCPDDGRDPIELWRGAEGVLRAAQAEGGGKAIWLSPEMRDDAEQKIRIEAALRGTLSDEGFYLAYQPLYGFNGEMWGMEALLRLNHARYGVVSPVKVIPIAEETGLIVPLGQWVIEQVCIQLRRWMDAGVRTAPVAVNVSALQLMRGDFAGQVMETLMRHEIEPRRVHLEVTETAVMRNLEEVSGQMTALSAMGISFSIDDFGTGHSSLGRLHRLPISVLKIDRSFIELLCEPNDTRTTLTIVQAVISMAHALGQLVVAEGVETDEQLECLRGLGCDLIQGYLLAKPLCSEAIPALLGTTHPLCAVSVKLA